MREILDARIPLKGATEAMDDFDKRCKKFWPHG